MSSRQVGKGEKEQFAPGLEAFAKPIEGFSEDAANVRVHDGANLDAIASSLRRFGQQKPIVVRPDGVILAGNGTFRAAKALGWTRIAAVKTQLETVEALAYSIADNRTAELATWDAEALAKSLGSIANVDKEALLATGFDANDLIAMLGVDAVPGPGKEGAGKEYDKDAADGLVLRSRWRIIAEAKDADAVRVALRELKDRLPDVQVVEDEVAEGKGDVRVEGPPTDAPERTRGRSGPLP